MPHNDEVMPETIIIGCDHAGFAAKEKVKEQLVAMGFQVTDVGCYSEQSVNYPVYAKKVAESISSGEYPRGILICGTGIGMSIAANRFRGVRAALCHDAFTAQASREHNDANVLCVGARVLGIREIKEIVELWLGTEFEGGRHASRVAMFEE